MPGLSPMVESPARPDKNTMAEGSGEETRRIWPALLLCVSVCLVVAALLCYLLREWTVFAVIILFAYHSALPFMPHKTSVQSAVTVGVTFGMTLGWIIALLFWLWGVIPAALCFDSSCPAKAGHLVSTGRHFYLKILWLLDRPLSRAMTTEVIT
jgi:peptidoglycan/LPS O-acetylase OafA/YrhL